ncbi:MAG: 4Fe-4S binding protein [Candidatus Brocadiae bacterium]|nr:4Fe-4S binding protein [Candidatus Brocadiia bacterium]
MTLRKTNLTTLFVWGIWWPGMIFVALVFGHAWCMVCPMELVNRLSDALARKIGWHRAHIGKFFRAGWLAIALYFIMQALVAGISIHRVPHYTAMLLMSLLGLAFFSGLIFNQHRSFCKVFCPVSALLSVYGRYTPIQLEVCNPLVCESCSTKDCVRPDRREHFDKRSCPSLLVPYRRDPSDGCVLCLQCVKVCPYQNMSVGVVSADAPVRQKKLLRPFEAAFVMIALGFVAHEVIGEVKWLDAFFHAVPKWLNHFLPSLSFGWFEAVWFLALFPLLIWSIIAAVSYFTGHRAGIRSLLLAAATGAAPIVAVAHIAKALAKISAWSGFVPLAWNDPHGLDTLHRITNHTLAAPSGLVGLPIIGWIMLVLIIWIGWRSLRSLQQMPSEFLPASRVSLITTAILFTSVLAVWAWTA